MVEYEDQTYDEINTEYEGEDIIYKADVTKQELSENLPIINVYFDQSGSWDEDDIAIGMRAVSSIQQFADQGEIELHLWYFSNHVHADIAAARSEGGTSAWYEILENIEATHANNVVIMTDHDMEDQALRSRTIKVDGYVWYI